MSLAQTLAIWAVPVLLAITVHEVAHGWVAYRFGDPTAAEAGRLTLNPFPHVDWLGTLVLPLAMVASLGVAMGWAKPVPVDASRLRRPREQMAWVAAAGPAANALMLIAWALIARLGVALDSEFGVILFAVGQAGIVINSVLMLLNLLPIPPLDGSVVVARWMPPELARKWMEFGRYGLIVVLALFLLGSMYGLIGIPLLAFIGAAHQFFGLPWMIS